MLVCKTDPSLKRVTLGGFTFPLGVYPIEEMSPKPGYTLLFESADGGEDEEWEEWPDRYLFDAVVTHGRLESLVWSLLSCLPAAPGSTRSWTCSATMITGRSTPTSPTN